jgi:Fe-S-cluster containining protein
MPKHSPRQRVGASQRLAERPVVRHILQTFTMSRTKPTDRSSRAHPRQNDHDAESELLRELDAVYRDVNARLSNDTCPASTECCRFGITGREPYVTSIEVALVERAIARRGGARTLGRAPAPLEPRAPADRKDKRRLAMMDEEPCPLLDAKGRCSVYDARPFGCRTYYCERATRSSDLGQRDINEFVRRIKDIAARHAALGDQGKPLRRALTSVRPR